MMQAKFSSELDDTDLAILDLLQRDARITMREIARQVCMSPPATAERVRRLEESGVITGYHAAVSPEKLGFGVHGYMIVDSCSPDKRRKFYALLTGLPEITEVERVLSGGVEAVLHFSCQDLDHLMELHQILAGGGCPNCTTHLCAAGREKLEPLSPETLARRGR